MFDTAAVGLPWRDDDRLHIDHVALEVLERDETHVEEVAVVPDQAGPPSPIQ